MSERLNGKAMRMKSDHCRGANARSESDADILESLCVCGCGLLMIRLLVGMILMVCWDMPQPERRNPDSSIQTSQQAYNQAISRIKNAGIQFREKGLGSVADPGLTVPEKGGVSAPLGPGKVRLMPVVAVAASQGFCVKGHSRLIKVSPDGAECGPSGAKLKPNIAYAAVTEYAIDAAKFASGVDDLLPIQVTLLETVEVTLKKPLKSIQAKLQKP